jgi:8-oxo-dGTP pyrophosphatase MutT (NUDIX family)
LYEQIAAYVPRGVQEERDRQRMLRCLDTQPDMMTRQNTLAHFTASAWIVNSNRDKVLMVYHNIYDSWAWTGGHADGETDLLSVALREAREETGLADVRAVSDEIFSLESLCVHAHLRRGVFVSAHIHLNVTFLLEGDDGAPLAAKPDENSAVRWVPTADSVQISNEKEMQIIYQKLNDRLARGLA